MSTEIQPQPESSPVPVIEKKPKQRRELTPDELKRETLLEPISFLSNIWRIDDTRYYIPIDKDVVKKYALRGIRVRVTIDPQTYILGESKTVDGQKAPTQA
jgi:hypothetical protein